MKDKLQTIKESIRSRALRLSTLQSSKFILGDINNNEGAPTNESKANYGKDSINANSLLKLIEAGDSYGFNQSIYAIIDQRLKIELENSTLEKIYEILEIPKDKENAVTKALQMADKRFMAGLYRSASLAFGLIYIAFKENNPWILYNWSRSLEKAHPEIYELVKDHIKKP